MKETEEVSQEITRVKQRFSIVGSSPALINAVRRAIRVAPIDLSVLVTGESGSGKEFFPKIIHQFGARKHKKYIAVNCGAIPEGTIDSELFGHEKGSFTGAIATRKGYFEEADGGTVFLDEVAELPLTTQARLLRVLETGEFLKVGSSQVQKTDIRIVAATNVDLLKAVKAGKFREDLYYRLSTIIINVPNLHDRGDDIPLLARKFAADFAEKYLTKPIRFADDAISLMKAYRWPGNVRQLKNIVEQLALFEAGTTVSRRALADALPHADPSLSSLQRLEDTHTYEAERESLWQALLSLKTEVERLRMKMAGEGPQDVRAEEADAHVAHPLMPVPGSFYDPLPLASPSFEAADEREQIISALRLEQGGKRAAARRLGMSERTLYRRIADLNITPADYSPHPSPLK